MDEEGTVRLSADDYRRERKYLAPSAFAWPDDSETTYPPPSDLVERAHWDSIMTLPTDVALKSTSYVGSLVGRLDALHTDWIFSWPEIGTAPYMEEVALLAGEEFDALVFNAAHGWYRQALGCLRNAFETMTVAAALSVRGDSKQFSSWRNGAVQVSFQAARSWIRDSTLGGQLDSDVSPLSVFGDDEESWTRRRYARLCAYAHSQAGYNNADFWESNGPIFVPAALEHVEAEFRETLALCYLLLRLGWPGYAPGPGEPALLSDAKVGWEQFERTLRQWLL